MPADGGEIRTDFSIFLLYRFFIHRIFLPSLRIMTILEHVDARMGDAWELLMEFSDTLKRFSWLRKGKSKDEVDIERYLLFVILRMSICIREILASQG